MEYINPGQTDIRVSRFCARCMSYSIPSPAFHLLNGWTRFSPFRTITTCSTAKTKRN